MKYDGKFEFLGRVFFSFFGSIRFASLEIVSGKSKVSKVFISILFSLLFLTGFAQETHNLEIIWQKASPESVFYFGRCIASGDVNGDSFSDIMIVGDSVIESPPQSDSCYRGVCWVYFGGANIDTIPDIRLSNPQKFIFYYLHSCDINGDGFDDIILGACDNAGAFGEVFIFLGGSPVDTICDYRIRGLHSGSGFGGAIGSGDVNGDGYDDLIIGACGAAPMPGGYMMGQVYIYYGGPYFDTIPDVILNGGHENDHEAFGSSVSASGDVNDDGFSDIIVGAMNFNWSRGRIYIYFGGNPTDTLYDVAISGLRSWQQLGFTGVDFLINPTKDNAIIGGYGLRKQEVCVLFGGSEMDSIPDVLLTTEGDSSYLSSEAVNAGFTRCNEASDALAGAPTEYNRKGTAYLWLGGEHLDSLPDAWIRGVQYEDGIGWFVATAGDVNGDGKDEVMISNYAVSETPERVWVCKYTGQGIEEHGTQNASRFTPEIYPNPAKSVIRVRCSLPVKDIKIYDITGKIIKTFDVRQMLESGQYEIKWGLRDDYQKKVATGIYFIEIKTESKESEIKKITVVK